MAIAEPLLLIGSVVGKTIIGFGQAGEEERAIRERETQNRIAADQQAIQRANKLRKVLGAQNAQAAASGISVGSSSLKAIEVSSINEAAQDQQLSNLQLDIENTNLERKKKEVQGAAMFNAFNNIFEATTAFTGTGGLTEEPKKFDIFGESE